jgi:23S rRNA (adenine2030-N6)-methyltransferase
MLSYQHAYHAGNPADLHKHATLAGLLALMTRKPRAITVMETHSGRGLYDLAGDEARKTGEADEGIARLETGAHPLWQAIAAIRAAHGDAAYPGSPLVTDAALRPQDRHILMELHPQEHRALSTAMRGTSAEIHKRDGFEGVLALSPPKPRRGLVLIDPSYEVKSEYEAVADFTHRLVAKWPEAVVMIWYPILPAARHVALVEGLKLPKTVDEVAFDLKGGKGMTGSGLILINAPYGSDQVLRDTRALCRGILR